MNEQQILDLLNNPDDLRIKKIIKDEVDLYVFKGKSNELVLFEEQARIIFDLTEMHGYVCGKDECNYEKLNKKLAPYFAPSRWRANIAWILHNGTERTEVYDIDEVEELHDLVEAGPDWGGVQKINITLEYRH